MNPLGIMGAFLFSPSIHGDERGSFQEWFRSDVLKEHLGGSMAPAQANCLVSARGVLRGVHVADVPPGQAKYVTCVTGAIVDVVVDLRVGSPTFGRWQSVRLDENDRRCLYIAEGLGHAVLSLADDTTVVYLCSEKYAPGHEHGINPLDPELSIEWPAGVEPILSPRDRAAPGITEARTSGLLPDYQKCLDHYAELGMTF